MLERIASFLENEYLSEKGLKVHKSLLSRVYSEGTKGYVLLPGKNKILVLTKVCQKIFLFELWIAGEL